jgi:SAM-dependent methyltransferase
MRNFIWPDTFEAALSMYTTFGYFEDQEENKQVLGNIYRSLKPGGTYIIDMMGKEVLARNFIERDWKELDNMLFLEERRVLHDWSWIENRWIMVRDGDLYEYKVSHWVYSATELKSMLVEAGFQSVEIYGSLEGAPYNHAAHRLVAVARK